MKKIEIINGVEVVYSALYSNIENYRVSLLNHVSVVKYTNPELAAKLQAELDHLESVIGTSVITSPFLITK